MEVTELALPGVYLIKPNLFTDNRGYFFEPYNQQRFIAAGLQAQFVQDNQSMSHMHAVRGLHFQYPPFEQGKLVSVITGAVLDIIVDIRKNSPFYGKSLALEINATNKWSIWIPPGFAHGFSTLEDNTIFQYKCTNYYNKNAEGGILWNDPDLQIDWKIDQPIVSPKDAALPAFTKLNSPF